MNFWFDTEFITNDSSFFVVSDHTVHLISIGIVAANGETLYIENADCPWDEASDWVKENVFPHLLWKNQKPLSLISHEIRDFVHANRGDERVNFWAYYGAYDWFLMCQTFGGFLHLPQGWHHYFNELATLIEMTPKGYERKPEMKGNAHNALDDAIWNKEFWEALQE